MSADPKTTGVLVSNDYAGIELVALAQCHLDMFGKSSLADAINAGKDLHTKLAARFGAISYEDALVALKAKDEKVVNLRKCAKPFNFGVPGLMGAPKIAFTARKDGVRFCELSGVSAKCSDNERVTEYGKGRSVRTISPTCVECLKLSEKYRALYFEEVPEMSDYHAITIRLAELGKRGQPLESFGNGMLRLETSANAVSNHFFQNRAAQGAKRAIAAIAKEAYSDRRSVLYNNCRTNLFVHDETMCEVREHYATECGWRVAQLMVSEMRELCPDVLVKVEPAVMRRWFKGADKKETREGRLVPWWPTTKGCSRDLHAKNCHCWTWAPDQERMWSDVATWQP